MEKKDNQVESTSTANKPEPITFFDEEKNKYYSLEDIKELGHNYTFDTGTEIDICITKTGDFIPNKGNKKMKKLPELVIFLFAKVMGLTIMK